MGIARPYVTPFLAEQVNLSEFQIGVFGSVSYAGVTFMGSARWVSLLDDWVTNGKSQAQ